MDLADYRGSAERFVSELTRSFYRHYSGLEERFEIEPIYARHAELFSREAVEGLRERLDRTPAGGVDHRRLELLLDFAVEGYVGQATKEVEAELAQREATATIELDGASIGFRDAIILQANEPDRDRRRVIDEGRLRVIEDRLGPLHQELVGRGHACAAELGYGTYRAMCEQVKRIELAELARQTAQFTAATETSYRELLEPELRRILGSGLEELRHSDLPRLFRAADDDPLFPASSLVASLRRTLDELGLDDAAGIVLDVGRRPRKSPRAFCAPVRVPEEVYLVIAPVGGRDDFAALFHEAGHAEHYAHMAPGLQFEFRHLGDNAVTESFAFLLEHLIHNGHWLRHALGIGDPDVPAAYGRAHKLLYLRRYAAKLAYELELHGRSGKLEGLDRRYAQLVGEALRIPWPAQTWLADLDPGFYCACYLRAWALETHLRHHLEARFGPMWFTAPQAGDELRALWRDGQRRSPEELLHDLTGAEIDFRVLLADFDPSDQV